ncbi:hypothetical protein HXX76_014406 [Chlamydomonas incerta]|uniref:Uncharacterized protein n=1 Tax=Chlamydomonas incerta TaxID=51695 RepID=A0A835VQZ7_CHLIN|nr:hypothetical protein HXX76_014406 [Chlamydomonas incerta]|eukprot:KAG2424525.1 hypothetical protein HXX76_014406 [Chlamydomonas incerta]
MEKCERKGFFYVGDEAGGDLWFFVDAAGPAQAAATYLVLRLCLWLHPWSTHLFRAMSWFAAPSGPARLVFGVDVQYPPPAGAPPRIEIFMQRPGQQPDFVTVSCGAGSGCVAPALREYTIFLPLHDVLFGVSWLTRAVISAQLAVLVPLYSLYGCLYAVCDVLRGRRSAWQLAKACVRSMWGPWWGVVPLDAFQVRHAVFMQLNWRQQLIKHCLALGEWSEAAGPGTRFSAEAVQPLPTAVAGSQQAAAGGGGGGGGGGGTGPLLRGVLGDRPHHARSALRP